MDRGKLAKTILGFKNYFRKRYFETRKGEISNGPPKPGPPYFCMPSLQSWSVQRAGKVRL